MTAGVVITRQETGRAAQVEGCCITLMRVTGNARRSFARVWPAFAAAPSSIDRIVTGWLEKGKLPIRQMLAEQMEFNLEGDMR